MYHVEKDPEREGRFMLVDEKGEPSSFNLPYSEAIKRRDDYNALRKAGDEAVEASIMRTLLSRISEARANKDAIALGRAMDEVDSYLRKS